MGATVGGRATTDDDDDDDDDEDEDALTRKNNKIFRKEANADKTLEMIIRQLMWQQRCNQSNVIIHCVANSQKRNEEHKVQERSVIIID